LDRAKLVAASNYPHESVGVEGRQVDPTTSFEINSPTAIAIDIHAVKVFYSRCSEGLHRLLSFEKQERGRIDRLGNGYEAIDVGGGPPGSIRLLRLPEFIKPHTDLVRHARTADARATIAQASVVHPGRMDCQPSGMVGHHMALETTGAQARQPQ
jgi:hypothetical protein